MVEFAAELISRLGVDVLEKITLAGRASRERDLPAQIAQGPLKPFLQALNGGRPLWSHQADALDLLLAGHNAVVATGTASGKSLIFQMYALHLVRTDPSSRIIVFYPLKALASDQFKRWQAAARAAGLPETAVARIDGDVPTYERDDLLRAANVLLLTPDVCQAWLMRAAGAPTVRKFLAETRLLVLDEAHSYESVFGSNVAFLIRRLLSARRHSARAAGLSHRMQVLAATATIAGPAEHLNALTGLEFRTITEADNGAPQHDRLIFHVNGAARGSAGELALSDIVSSLTGLPERRRFIAFIDSRQGTERVASKIGAEDVLPYRSGFEATDRAKIEEALRTGSLHGVISTSALELGIDIPDMEIGLNLGVPNTRKSFRQRIGRIGRSAPGVFFLIAPPEAFLKYGETFSDYYNGSVEPSYLYTGNRFVQYAHARCLLEEMEVLGQEKSSLPAGVDWPARFEESLRIARPGGGRPREYDLIAQIGADDPHIHYPLRQVGEATFDLKLRQDLASPRIGTIAGNQAIREAYPGANYLHLGKPYKVQGWVSSSFERAIRLDPAQSYVPTKPILRKTVTFALDHAGVIEGRIRRSGNGLVAEVQLQVNEAVEGYTIGSTPYLYRTLRVNNPNMSRRQRDIRTTGIVLRLSESWFAGSKGGTPKCREAIAHALMEMLCRERSIAPTDVDFAYTNIAVMTDGAPRKVVDAIVIYDTVYGGLRLSEDLFTRFSDYAAQLDRAAAMAGKHALVPDDVTEMIKSWASELKDADVAVSAISISPNGMYMVYRPGSTVGVYIQGELLSREIIAPRMIDLGDGDKQLGYTYNHHGRKSIVRHEEVQPVGDDASFVYWNPTTGHFQELDDPDGLEHSATEDGWILVYRPGSAVLVPRYGEKVKRAISTPTLMDTELGGQQVHYQYADDGGTAFVLHDEVEASGNDWGNIFWNPLTNQFREVNSADDKEG